MTAIAAGKRKARTPKAWGNFLSALEKTGNVTKACKLAQMPLSTVYDKRDSDPEFAVAWGKALDRAIVLLEDEAHRRAFDGVDRPVFYQGEQCGSVREYSDTLLIFLLKGARPDRYRERTTSELTGPAGGPIDVRGGEIHLYLPTNGRG